MKFSIIPTLSTFGFSRTKKEEKVVKVSSKEQRLNSTMKVSDSNDLTVYAGAGGGTS